MEGVVRIPLTQGYYTVINAEDYEIVSNYKWRFQSEGYAVTSVKDEDGGYKALYMHRLIAGKYHDCTGLFIDHVNGNGLDNRTYNLRLCNFSQNNCNARISKKNKSGIKGLSEYPDYFIGKINVNKKRYTKRSKDKNVVIEWLKEMRDRLHGEFARHS